MHICVFVGGTTTNDHEEVEEGEEEPDPIRQLTTVLYYYITQWSMIPQLFAIFSCFSQNGNYLLLTAKFINFREIVDEKKSHTISHPFIS